jgi:hypothetical protein
MKPLAVITGVGPGTGSAWSFLAEVRPFKESW